MKLAVYANYFYDTLVIFSNYVITYREPFTICIVHDRRTDVIGIDWTWYGWSTHGPSKCAVFQPDPPRNRSRAEQKLVTGWGGGPSSRNFFRLESYMYNNEPNAKHLKQWSTSMWDEVLLFLVLKSNFLIVFDIFLDSVILPYMYFNAVSIGFYAVKCLIYIYYYPRATRCGGDIVTLPWFRRCVRQSVRPCVRPYPCERDSD